MPLVFESPYWTPEGVCMKHMHAQIPCPECMEVYDQHIHASLDKEAIDILRYGLVDEYLESLLEDLKEFWHRQILFRNFKDQNGHGDRDCCSCNAKKTLRYQCQLPLPLVNEEMELWTCVVCGNDIHVPTYQ